MTGRTRRPARSPSSPWPWPPPASPDAGGDRSPRRVPDDGAPCSAIMPGAATSGEAALSASDVRGRDRAIVGPAAARGRCVDPPKDVTSTSCDGRRAGWVALRDAALLDAAAARVARGIALQDGTKPSVAKVAPARGRRRRRCAGRRARSTTPPGSCSSPTAICEVTILGAHTDADSRVLLRLAQVQVRP